MEKKNTFLRIAVIAMVAALFATCMLAGTTTLAMYTATATGTSSPAAIAKFAVFVGSNSSGDNITDGTITSFPLFDTITELNAGAASGTLQAGNAMDEQVKNDGTKNLVIAPGTDGAFEVDVFNDSDVTVKVTVAVTCTGTDLGDLNATDNGFSISGGGTLTDVVLEPGEKLSDASIAVPQSAAARTFTWAWEFANTATALTADTDIGIAAYAGSVTGPTGTITVTATQVD